MTSLTMVTLRTVSQRHTETKLQQAPLTLTDLLLKRMINQEHSRVKAETRSRMQQIQNHRRQARMPSQPPHWLQQVSCPNLFRHLNQLPNPKPRKKHPSQEDGPLENP